MEIWVVLNEVGEDSGLIDFVGVDEREGDVKKVEVIVEDGEVCVEDEDDNEMFFDIDDDEVYFFFFGFVKLNEISCF